MKLKEETPEAHNILGEEVKTTEEIEVNTTINNDDFTVNDFGDESTEEKKDTKTETTNKSGEETTKVTEKTETTNADGSKVTHTTTTQTTEVNQAKARQFKPNIMFTMWDMFIPKIGTSIWPKTPNNHWKLDAGDKTDLSILITESANEGNWSGVPTKWFLLIAVAAIVLVKVRMRNEVNEQKTENLTNNRKSIQELANEHREQQTYKQKLSELEEKFIQLQKTNSELLEKLKQNQGTAYYQEINASDIQNAEKLSNDAKDIISNIYKGHDLDKIRFSAKGGFVEKEKAGQKGYNAKGVKIGTPSTEMKEIFTKWKHYHEVKSGEVPYFVV